MIIMRYLSQLDKIISYSHIYHMQVCSVLQHSSYNSGTVDYDFAVLRLCDEVTFQVTFHSIVSANRVSLLHAIQ